MKEKYAQVVGQEESTIDLKVKSSFIPPWEVREAPGKGRGLFATSPIRKGDPLWDPSSHAVFQEEEHFVEFLDLVGYDLACEILQWAYTEPCDEDDDSEEEGCFVVGVELGEGSLMNTVTDIKGEVPNVGWCNVGAVGVELQKLTGCDEGDDTTFALRDIAKGEEILSDYRQFDNDGALEWFDRLNEFAWETEEDSDEEDSNDDNYDEEEEIMDGSNTAVEF
jgi:hypothetical protein